MQINKAGRTVRRCRRRRRMASCRTRRFSHSSASPTTAVPPAYLSLSSLDFNKWVTSIGGGLYVGKHWRFDAVLAHVFAQSVYVDPNSAQIPRINPLPGNAPLEPVNGGHYSASANIVGVGLNYKF